jgi:uncharacterized protein YdeI (YjbR/CyaY-like superfamily)
MENKDPRIDTYIEKKALFAQEILTHLRKVIHQACPEVNETIKWGHPHFEYKNQVLCSIAGFKEHCAFAFWRSSLMKDPYQLFETGGKTAMGQMGELKDVKTLPSDKILIEYIQEAAVLIEMGAKVAKPKSENTKTELEIPDYFLSELKKNKAAFLTFEKFSYTNKKEYLTWVTEAKTDATRNTRLATAIEWMAEGKDRNWKYKK